MPKYLQASQQSELKQGDAGHAVFRAYFGAWKPADRRKPWQWCEDNVRVDDTSPMPGKWRSENSPWVRDVMETFADSSVNDISIMCSAQSAKTQTIMCLMLYALKEDPGPMQYVMAAADEAKTFVRTRLGPSIEACDAVHALLGYADVGSALEINFPGAALLVTGANSKSKLQSNPKRYLFLDEVRNYPPGAYEMVRKRVRAFWNSKVITISTPDMANDHVHRAFALGDQRTWHFECPMCGHLQPVSFARLKWDENQTTRPGGRWNIDAAADTLRFECAGCQQAIKDTPMNRKHIITKGRWVRMNPSAPSNRVSYTWNAMLPPWVKWRDIMEEFLLAHGALKLGDHEPYKAFINETLGEPWEDRLREVTDFGALESCRRPYQLGEPWAEETDRMAGIDKQKDHFRFVVRAYGPGGESRLVAFGRVDTEEQLEEAMSFYKVPNYNVLIDTGYDTASVYRLCLKNKWKAFKGTNAEYYADKDENGDPIRRVYTKSPVDPKIGTAMQGKVKPIKLYLWSNPMAKDLLAMWMSGAGPAWTIPCTDSEAMNDYIAQATAEVRAERTDAKGRTTSEWIQVRKDNHYRDCELMLLVAAIITGKVPKAERKAAQSRAPKPDEAAVESRVRTFELTDDDE